MKWIYWTFVHFLDGLLITFGILVLFVSYGLRLALQQWLSLNPPFLHVSLLFRYMVSWMVLMKQSLFLPPSTMFLLSTVVGAFSAIPILHMTSLASHCLLGMGSLLDTVLLSLALSLSFYCSYFSSFSPIWRFIQLRFVAGHSLKAQCSSADA